MFNNWKFIEKVLLYSDLKTFFWSDKLAPVIEMAIFEKVVCSNPKYGDDQLRETFMIFSQLIEPQNVSWIKDWKLKKMAGKIMSFIRQTK